MCINRYRYNCMCELRIIMKLYPTIRNCFVNCILILKFHLVMNLILRETNNFYQITIQRWLFLFLYLHALLFCFCIHLNIHPSHAFLYFISCSLDLSFFKAKGERERGWLDIVSKQFKCNACQNFISPKLKFPASLSLSWICSSFHKLYQAFFLSSEAR